MQFAVDEQVFQDIPDLWLAVGWLTLARQPLDAEAADWIAAPWQGVSMLAADPLQTHPLLAPWRDVFRALGLPVRDYLPSVEALARRARKGGPALRVQPLVDAYNAISLRRLVPVGAFDLARVQGDLRLGRTRGGEAFRPIGAEQEEAAAPGELCYLDAGRVLTRHFVWRQSEYAKIASETRRLFLIAELLPAAHPLAAEVLGDFEDLAASLGGHAQTALLSEDAPRSALGG